MNHYQIILDFNNWGKKLFENRYLNNGNIDFDISLHLLTGINRLWDSVADWGPA